ILAEPEVSGIEDLSGEALLFRVTVRCEAGQQVEVARALRLACLTALTDAGVELVGATRMTVVAPAGSEAGPGAASTAATTGSTPSTTRGASATEPASD